MVWNRKGTTFTEALATISLAAIVASLGAVGVSRHYLDMATTGQELLNSLRQARMEATRRGAHHRVALFPTSYRVERMADTDGNGLWEDDSSAPSQQVALPRHLSLAVQNAEVGTLVEFNSRGMVVGEEGEIQDDMIEIVLTDSRSDETMQIRVWPSGQIELSRPGNPVP
jgi:Tfp pilus assembly protein FimT